jgi:hypothetical protein
VVVSPWSALVTVAVVAAAAAMSAATLVGFALVGLSWRRSTGRPGGSVLPTACLVAAGLVVAWGVARVIGAV